MKRILSIFICGLFTISLAAQQSQAPAQNVLHIATALNHLTVLEFHEPVTMAAAGSSDFQIERQDNIELRTQTEVVELIGERSVEAMVVRDNSTGEQSRLDATALFVFVGADPHTDWLAGEARLDDKGFVLTGAELDGHADDAPPPLMLETSAPGVFAVGDVRSGSIKRVASAVGEGSMAVRLVHQHLADQ